MANEIDKVKKIFGKSGAKKEEVNGDNDFENIYDRSQIISGILQNYKDQQDNRNKYKVKVKKAFVPIFCVIALLFALATIAAVILSFVLLKENTGQFITAIISSLIGGFTTIGTIMLIIVRYIFPNDEETNFNNLISIIVKNDTERLNHIYHYHEGDSSNG